MEETSLYCPLPSNWISIMLVIWFQRPEGVDSVSYVTKLIPSEGYCLNNIPIRL